MRRNEWDGNSNANGYHCWDWKIPLEKEMAMHSSILAWKIPWMEEPGRLQSMWSQRVEHDWATSLSFLLYIHHFTYPQDILFGGFVLLHSTILPKGRLRHHMVIWLTQDCRTEPVFKSMSLPWYMHKILIMCLIKMIRKHTGPLQWQLYLNTDS